MLEILQKITDIPAPFNMIVLIVMIGAFAGIITTIAKEVRKYACHRQELDFKRELVEQGMTSHEIEHIMTAKPDRSRQSLPS